MATLDPGIILSGRGVNALGAVAGGYQLRAQADEMARQNALAQFMRQNGGALMRGDANALAGYAAFDPQGAVGLQSSMLGMESTRLGMDATRLGMEATRAEMSRAEAETQRAQADADRVMFTQRLGEGVALAAQGNTAALQAFIEREGLTGMAPADPQAFQAWAAGVGADMGLVDTFAPDEPAAPVYQGGQWWDVQPGQTPTALTAPEPPKPADDYERYVREERAAGRQPLSRIDFARAIKGDQTSRVILGPDGQAVYVEGGAEVVRNFTEAQTKDVVLASRGRDALEALEASNPSALTSRTDAFLGNGMLNLGGLGLGRGMQSSEYQVAEQAARNFLAVILRKDTGAAVTDAEMDLYGSIFLPQPGDSPEVVEAKRQARQQAIASLEASLSPQQIVAQGRALIEGNSGATPAGNGFVPAPQQGITMQPTTPDATPAPPVPLGSNLSQTEWETLWSAMPPEDRDLFTQPPQ